MEQRPYQVQLPTFQGPLDLLLHLIEQQELDITTISLAQVTDQYLAYLRVVQDIHPDDLADFMTVAARLLLIKSRALLPVPPQAVEEEEDIGEDLVRQLREYRRFKQAAQALDERDHAGLHMYPRSVPTARLITWEPKLDLADTSLDDLVKALHDLLSEQVAPENGTSIVPLSITIDDKIEQISDLLRSHAVLTFDGLLQDATSRVEIIVTLLAVLELVRSLHVSVRQEQLFGEILITPVQDSDRPANVPGDG
jgi:segregation and condensation protein A